MISIIPLYLLLVYGLYGIYEYKTSKAMKEEFEITPGLAPDSALNPLRANLSKLALREDIHEEDRKMIEDYRDNL